MRYFICKNNDSTSNKLAKKILEFLKDKKNFVLDEKNPELIISIGGDGRFLRAINKYKKQLNSFAIVGISTGKLGYLCDYIDTEIELFLSDITTSTPRYESRKLLEVKRNRTTNLFVNEFRLETLFETIELDVEINNKQFVHFKGNGINIATSTGSTAYNKSLNGPIVNTYQNLMIYQEIAPINNKLNQSLNTSLILSDRDSILLKGDIKEFVVGGDFDYEVLHNKKIEIEIYLSEKKVIFAHFKPYHFYQKVKDKFIGGN